MKISAVAFAVLCSFGVAFGADGAASDDEELHQRQMAACPALEGVALVVCEMRVRNELQAEKTASAPIPAPVLVPPLLITGRPLPMGFVKGPCGDLQHKIDDAEKEIAGILADGYGDNSAVRETMRQSQMQTIQQRQLYDLSQLTGRHCRAPRGEPSGGMLYYAQALTCGTAALQGSPHLAEICDRSAWRPGVTLGP